MSRFQEFEDIAAQERYPGSRHPIQRAPKKKAAKDPDAWDAKPKVYKVKGEEVEAFNIGALAKALNREPVTMRKWERDGILPISGLRKPSADPRGRRRLYTRAQIEGIVRIAKDEGILHAHQKPIKNTNFTERVLQLFKELSL